MGVGVIFGGPVKRNVEINRRTGTVKGERGDIVALVQRLVGLYASFVFVSG